MAKLQESINRAAVTLAEDKKIDPQKISDAIQALITLYPNEKNLTLKFLTTLIEKSTKPATQQVIIFYAIEKDLLPELITQAREKVHAWLCQNGNMQRAYQHAVEHNQEKALLAIQTRDNERRKKLTERARDADTPVIQRPTLPLLLAIAAQNGFTKIFAWLLVNHAPRDAETSHEAASSASAASSSSSSAASSSSSSTAASPSNESSLFNVSPDIWNALLTPSSVDEAIRNQMLETLLQKLKEEKKLTKEPRAYEKLFTQLTVSPRATDSPQNTLLGTLCLYSPTQKTDAREAREAVRLTRAEYSAALRDIVALPQRLAEYLIKKCRLYTDDPTTANVAADGMINLSLSIQKQIEQSNEFFTARFGETLTTDQIIKRLSDSDLVFIAVYGTPTAEYFFEKISAHEPGFSNLGDGYRYTSPFPPNEQYRDFKKSYADYIDQTKELVQSRGAAPSEAYRGPAM